MTQIIIRNLTKRYGDAAALNNLSLTINSGEFLVLLGPSGCGKTTLLRCLAGLETPDDGEIIMGDDVVFSSRRKLAVAPGKRDLGMVFQSYALWPHMTVRDNVKFGLDARKTARADTDKRLDQVLSDVGLGDLGHRYPSELSGGQQQRVALARLLAIQPGVFLMDEPLSNLDARLRMDMRVELKRFQAKTGATTVYVTHDQTEAMTMSTRVVVIKDGEIQQLASPQQLYSKPANTFVADFIGMPRINLISVEADAGSPTSFSNDDIQVDVGWETGVKKAIIGARPEDLSLSDDLTRNGQDYEVAAVLPNGPETIVQVRRGNTSVIARVAHDVYYTTGQTVRLTYKTSSLNVYDAATGLLLAPPNTRSHDAANS